MSARDINIKDLFSGVAIAIDDEANNPKSNIGLILKQIRNEQIPYVAYDSLPSEKAISHFKNLSFIILDWNLNTVSTDAGQQVQIGEEIKEQSSQDNIEFLKKISEEAYCPIFIFTDEDVTEITEKLVTAQIFSKNSAGNIFIRSKASLTGASKVFSAIKKWVKKNPSIYVLKEWEKEYQRSRGHLFRDFQKISAVWPRVMWRNFKDDGDNQSIALGELITKNLHTRMRPFQFSSAMLGSRESRVSKDELRRVLEGEKYISESSLDKSDIATGDVFKINNNDGSVTYYLNIRPQCDLMRERVLDKIQLYCLKGRCIENKLNQLIFNKGHFIEKNNHIIVPFLDNGHIIEFKFQDLKIETWGKFKDHRIGRLLSPHINCVQQKYASYLQRQGLPRTPQRAIRERKRREKNQGATNR